MYGKDFNQPNIPGKEMEGGMAGREGKRLR